MKQRAGILIVMLLVLGASFAAAAGPPIAEVENYGDELVFDPVVEFERLILTVTGPCSYEYRRVVSEGDVSFQLDDTTIDGAYTYQLVRIEEISGDVIEALERARAKNDEETPKELCRDGKLPGPPVVQAEGFLVSKGEIIYDPEAVEKSLSTDRDRSGAGAAAGIPTKDHLINDDLIVDGSACIGFDCVNGESFGFDTLRLKENNLRIKFEDTSVAASYPDNDWQLTANDSANGGANKFSIDDITGNRTPFTVEANAPSHSLYIDDSGRIGNRTSTPSVELHSLDGDTPTLRLQQDGSSGFAAQTWDVAGNETNFFVRDVSNGSTLPFRIQPGAPSTSIYIDADGEVGLGTTTPDDLLHVENSDEEVSPGIRIVNTDVDTDGWSFRVVDVDEFRISKQSVSGPEFKIDADGNVTIKGTLTVRDGEGDETTYPDYVFEPGYPLMPLADLGMFVEENRHLPRIPPAAELARNGLNMTEMQIKLLEKVEELTLYVLALEKTNAGLEARLAALEGGADK
ncbi:MAG: hypothetical protein GY856_23195 [bacterium]|nr:hypothetical protein [bacterium]